LNKYYIKGGNTVLHKFSLNFKIIGLLFSITILSGILASSVYAECRTDNLQSITLFIPTEIISELNKNVGQIYVEANYLNGERENVTNQALVSSSSPSIAYISYGGNLYSGNMEGQVTFTANFCGKTSSAAVTVKASTSSSNGLPGAIYGLNATPVNSNQINFFEATQVINLIKRIWENGVYEYGTSNRYNIIKFLEKCIGVVVPHKAQRTEIQSQLIKYFIDELRIYESEKIEKNELQQKIISCVDTVEKYQGQEREIMICSYVLGDIDVISQEEEFIYSPNRLNVMISRARFKAIVLASNELIMNISNNLDIIDIQKGLRNLTTYCNEICNLDNIK
jgi:hypothetical protein